MFSASLYAQHLSSSSSINDSSATALSERCQRDLEEIHQTPKQLELNFTSSAAKMFKP